MKLHRRRIRCILFFLAFVLLFSALFYRFRLTPLMKELAVTEVENQASDVISDAIGAQIANGSIDYNRIITLEKNSAGQITALKTNMAEVNQLRREILEQVNQRILDLNVYALAVPLGSVLAPALLAGLGPRIPIHVTSVNNANADFTSNFSEAGINQTLHQILMHVSMDVTILIGGGTKKATIRQSVVVAETVIVGIVPESFLNIGT